MILLLAINSLLLIHFLFFVNSYFIHTFHSYNGLEINHKYPIGLVEH